MQTVNNEMIILAREARGWSQVELAARIGMSATNLSKIERGAVRLQPAHVREIAQATAFPPQFFLQPGGILPAQGLFRRRNKVAQKLLTPIHARADILRRQVQTLTGALGIEPPVLVRYRGHTEGAAERAAGALRRAWDLPAGPVSNLSRAIEGAGIAVLAFDFGTERVDSQGTRTEGGHPLLLVNRRQGGDRQRFSLAYELGLLVLGEGVEEPAHDAKRFAAELLMPEADIRADLAGGVTIERLAQLKPKWKVSMIALLYRAHDLGLLTPNQRRYLLQQFNEQRIRRHEPAALDIPFEEPGLVKRWLATYRFKTGLNTLEMAALLCLELEDFLELYG